MNKRHGTSYAPHVRIVNALDYGVPQRRERAIVVALRDGGRWEWPEPTHIEQPVRAWDALSDLPAARTDPPVSGRWARLLPSIPEGWNYQWHTDRGGGRRLFGYRTKYWSFLLKLAKNQPAWTLPAHPGPATGPFHWDNRRLTRQEMLRLQSFPSSWKVLGSYADQVRQIGNATPPLLAEVMGRAIVAQVFGLKVDGRHQFKIPRKRNVPRARQRSPVAREYLHLEGRHAAHPGTGAGPKPVTRA